VSEQSSNPETYSQDRSYLTGKLVIAMPHLEDSRFYQAVIYICGHDETGAMGIMVNKPLSSVNYTDLLDQLSIHYPPTVPNLPIHYGGPVEIGRGFVLHTAEYMTDSSTLINDNLALTATLDILRAIAFGTGPVKHLMALGYVGWGAFQLEQEIQNNGWIVIDVAEDLIFTTEIDTIWKSAMASIGVNPNNISLDYGHA
jgi:putative transcriptional regulator